MPSPRKISPLFSRRLSISFAKERSMAFLPGGGVSHRYPQASMISWTSNEIVWTPPDAADRFAAQGGPPEKQEAAHDAEETTMTIARHLLACAALLGLGASVGRGAAPAVAQDKTVTLRLGHWLPPAQPLHPAWQEWGKSLEQATNGTLKIQIFPAQQLGAAKDHYDM